MLLLSNATGEIVANRADEIIISIFAYFSLSAVRLIDDFLKAQSLAAAMTVTAKEAKVELGIATATAAHAAPDRRAAKEAKEAAKVPKVPRAPKDQVVEVTL